MAEYIDRKDVIFLIEKNRHYVAKTSKQLHQNDMADAIVKDLYHNIPTANVIEREKIDKAIEEMERYSTSFECANRHDLASAVDCCIGMIEKNIGESK